MTSERDRDRVLEAALARACARTPDRVPPCPDPEALAVYIERRLGPEDAERVEAHLASCLSCQAEVALIVRSAPPADARPSLVSAAWWRTRWLAWAAPAAAATVALAVWVGSRPAPSPPAADLGPQARADLTPEAGSPPVAASTPDQQAGTLAGPTPRAPADAAAAQPSDPRAFGAPAPAPGQAERGGREPVGAADERDLAAALAKPAESAPEARFSPELPAAPRTPAAPPLTRPAAAPSAAPPMAASPTGSEGSSAAPPGRTPTARPAEATTGAATAAAAVRTREEAAAASQVARAPSGHVVEPDAGAHSLGARPAGAAALASEQAAGPGAGVGATRRFASPSGRVVWEITAAGELRCSLDGGVHWGEPQAGDPRLVAGTAVSDTEAWAIGREGIVWRTSDGATWMSVSRPGAVDLVSIVATSGGEAVVTAADGRTFHTTDGGRTWRER